MTSKPIFAASGVSPSLAAVSDWEEKTNGLYGAEGLSIAINSSGHLFLGTNAGALYRSTNSGDTWEVVHSFVLGIPAVAVDLNDNIYVANHGTSEGLQRSTDGGVTFTAVGLGGVAINKVVAATSLVLYAATTNGLYKSTDGGVNWVQQAFPGANVLTVAVAPDAAVLLATNSGIYRSTDGGANFFQLTGTILDATAFAFNSSGHIFVTTVINGVYRSTNGGATWTQLLNGIPNDPFPPPWLADIVIDSGDNIFICSSRQLIFASNGEGFGGVYRSTDNGDSWQTTGVIMTFAHGLVRNASDHIFTATRGFGAYRSTNNGATWTVINNGLRHLTVNAIVADGSGAVFAATHGAGMYRSLDAGDTWTSAWTQVTGSVRVGYLESLAINSLGHLFAGANIAGMYRSTDGGQTWQHLDPFQVGLGGVGVNAIAVNSQDHLFAGVNINGVFGSQDGGNTWTQRLIAFTDVDMLAVGAADGVFAGSNLNGLFFSGDDGATWQGVAPPSSGLVLSTIATDAAGELLAGYRVELLVSPLLAGIYRLPQPGQPWEQLLSAFATVENRTGPGIAIGGGGSIVAGGTAGAAMTTDNGQTWAPFSSGLPNASLGHINRHIYTVAFGGWGFAYAGVWNNGVFRTVGSVTGVDVPRKVAGELHTPMPNPAAGSARIAFSQARSGQAQIEIFDVRGRRVRRLMNEWRPAGDHEVTWDRTDARGRLVPSGVYFVRLRAPEFEGSTRLIVIH